MKAVVNIESIREVQYGGGRSYDPFFDFFGFPYGYGGGEPQTREQRAGGSGVIISTDGYIVTNNHVIEESTKLKVKLNDGRLFDAKLVGTDPTTDIALIKIEGEDLPTVAVRQFRRPASGRVGAGHRFALRPAVDHHGRYRQRQGA